MVSRSSPDPWERLRELTHARIALGRAGGSLPTRAWLDFKLAHAKARDAVAADLDVERLELALGRLGMACVRTRSAASSLAEFLRRPDLGRALPPREADALRAHALGADLALVASGGLSAKAVERQLVPLLAELLPELEQRGLTTSLVVLVPWGRVALGDPIGAALGARAVLVLLGERPGLATPASLGAYLTFDPRPGRSDAERNCVSNIHEGGLSHRVAARKIAWLVGEALRRGLTGVELKDEEGAPRLEARAGDFLTSSADAANPPRDES